MSDTLYPSGEASVLVLQGGGALGSYQAGIYEALADYFGHSGHDTRALRKDYDAERARVDKLINNLIGGTR